VELPEDGEEVRRGGEARQDQRGAEEAVVRAPVVGMEGNGAGGVVVQRAEAIGAALAQEKIAPAETALQTLRNNEPVLVRRSDTKKRAFFSAVNVYCDGSADKITGLNCQVMSRASLPPSGVPEGLHDARPTTRGVAEAAWKRNRRSFLVQTCTNPADAATFAEPVYVSKAKYRLTGQTPGAVLHIRVLTLDAKLLNGKSDWTPWVPINVAV
jgi:hypothetical protein